MGNINKRLEQLEQRTQTAKGIRVFKQSLGDEGAYYEDDGQGAKAWSRAEIGELGTQGWRCIVIEYAKDWRADSDNQIDGLWVADQ